MHDRLSPYQNWDKVAESIGGKVTTDRLLRLAQRLDQGLHMAHGVKEARSLEKIEEEGIIPNSHGNVSFWALGSGIFTLRDFRKPIDMLDSPFFNYGHSRAPRGHMLIALTRHDLLDGLMNGRELRPGYSVTFDVRVPREKFVLLHVVGGENNHEREQAMFELLEEAAEQGYAGGEERVRDLSA